MQFRPDIQGLRAIAVLAVILFHLNPAWLPGGFVGVDIFLVISGFLISSILLHKKSQAQYSLAGTLSYFYKSRVKRIAPAYFTTLILVSVVAAVLFLPADFKTYQDSLRKAAWFNSNNYFATFGDYFAPANHEQPLLHTWSLAVEIQFYLLAPFIFLLLTRKQLRWLLPCAIIMLTVYAEYRLQQGIEQATYYSLAARLPAFFMGGWIALLIAYGNRFRWMDRQRLWLSSLATTAIVLAFVQPKLTGHFPGIAGLLPVTAAAGLIWLNANNAITRILSSKTLVWIGALSYSLYLWHWPVLAFMRYYSGTQILDMGFSLAFVVLTLLLASLSYYWIETPLRASRVNLKTKLGYALLIMSIGTTAYAIKPLNAAFTPEPLAIEYTRYGDDALNCHGHIVGNCLRGDLSSDKEILVLGDSHAAMLNHFFDYLGKELGFKARIITASSCVTIPSFDYQRIAEWAHKPCLAQIEEAQKYTPEAKTIFLAASWNWHLQSAAFKQAMSDFLDKNAHTNIHIISQEPLLKFHPMRNYRFEYLGVGRKASLDIDYLRTNHWLEQQILNRPHTSYLELSKLPMFDKAPLWNGQLTYCDEHHLNEVGVLEYAKEAAPIIKQALFND